MRFHDLRMPSALALGLVKRSGLSGAAAVKEADCTPTLVYVVKIVGGKVVRELKLRICRRCASSLFELKLN